MPEKSISNFIIENGETDRMRYFKVKNFEKYQPKRRTKHQPWVCLYVNWTQDWAVTQLHDSYKAHWACLVCTAHTTDNRIPYDPVWIKRQHNLNTNVDLKVFEKLGLIELWDAKTEIQQNEKSTENRVKEKKVKESKAFSYDIKLVALFDEDWNDLPRKDGNRKKAQEDWMKTVGKDIAKLHPVFRKKLKQFKKSVEGREKNFIKTGQTFIHNWQDLEFDNVPTDKNDKTGGAVL